MHSCPSPLPPPRLLQAYALGIPLLVPSLALLASAHSATGIASHKGAGNTPWRPSRGRASPPFLNRWLVKDNLAWFVAPPPSGDVPCCAAEPDDACTPAAAAKFLQFADWHQWPHITYFDTPQAPPTPSPPLAKGLTFLASAPLR